MSVKQQLCTCITHFLYTSLPARLRRQLPNFTYHRQREHTTTNFSFSPTLNIFFKNSAPGQRTKWACWDNCTEVSKNARSIFKWRFRPRRRCGYLKLPIIKDGGHGITNINKKLFCRRIPSLVRADFRIQKLPLWYPKHSNHMQLNNSQPETSDILNSYLKCRS